ncbi:MAG: ATP synthase subunit I [Actinobacteria bacterium]|nr:ATP synthase subunit I [Actinomycetota bacterium]MCB9389165.1 ATP synthase subunit I [Acidimicrobiia bacterium]
MEQAAVAPIGSASEAQIANHLVRVGLIVAPVLIVIAAAFQGSNGAASATYAIVCVLLNFALAAALLSMAARISLSMIMVAALGGYVLRLALLAVAFLLVKDQPWMEPITFGITLIVTHLGLLFWEMRSVQLHMASPYPEKSLAKE